MHDDAARLSLVEMLEHLRSSRLTAEALVESCLARVAAAEPAVKAFAVRTDDAARTAARVADERRARDGSGLILGGVPVAVKDSFLTRGVAARAGSVALPEVAAEVDATVWARLLAEGAGLIGKTNMHEFAYGTASGETVNPWDVRRTSGGSSGGSAAALAARMAPAALGTDTGGSLRIPASACGVCTLRSATGRVPTWGTVPLSPTLDVAGPMARRMRDVSLLMRIMLGSVPGDLPWYPDRPPESLAGVRIGMPVAMSWQGIDASIAAVCRDALRLLETRGARLVDVTSPPETAAVLYGKPATFDAINSFEAYREHRALKDRHHLYGEQVRDRVLSGRDISEGEYLRALRQQSDWQRSWRRIFAENQLSAVAHPTLGKPPPLMDSGREPGIKQSVPWALAGFPALTVPVGLDVRRLPVGLTLSAPPEVEGELVGLGIAIDEEIRFWTMEPPV